MTAVNSSNKIVDPTENVLKLVEEAVKRADDLRKADLKYNDSQHEHLKEISELRAVHAETLRISDLDRLDKTRQVDVSAGLASAAGLVTAVQTLAKQTSDLAVTLAAQTDSKLKDVDLRIADLQKAMYQSSGKSSVTDPALAELINEVKKLGTVTTSSAGQSRGMRDLWGWIIAGAAVLYEILSLANNRHGL
jgi:hypothetical protein